MTAIITRTDPATTADYLDEDDGCEVGNHRRDELCGRTRLETLSAGEPEPHQHGGAT